MSDNTISKCIPVPDCIKKHFINLLLPDECIDSFLDKLEYCVNPEVVESIWDKNEAHTKIPLTPECIIDESFQHHYKPEQMKNDCIDSSCDIGNFIVEHKGNMSIDGNGEKEFLKSPKMVIKNKENPDTNEVTWNRRSKRFFHSTPMGVSLEKLSSCSELSSAAASCNEGTLSDSECSFNEPSKSVIKKCKKEEWHITHKKHKTKYKSEENTAFKNNTSCKRTIDHRDSDLVETNQDLSYKTSSHLHKTINGNTSINIESDLSQSDENAIDVVSRNLQEATIFPNNQERSLTRLNSNSSQRNSWLSQFELFVAAKKTAVDG